MTGPAARVRRALGYIVGAAIVGIPASLLLVQMLRLNDYSIVALPLLVGLGTLIGLKVAAVEPQTADRISLWDRSIDLASLILLGILCGGLPAALANGRASGVAVEAAIALAFLAFGTAAARTLARWHLYDAQAIHVAPFCAILGTLYGVSMIIGFTLASMIVHQPCAPHAWCIEPDWLSLMLTRGLAIGFSVGLWLTLTLWLALIVGRRATSQQPAPLAS
ncbi:MAG TPA: hypothetical protein VF510_07000 [Ktedonobacterales bacterium]